MKELVNAQSVEKAFLFLAVAGPLMGMILGIMVGAHERDTCRRIIQGLLIGALGTLVYALWHVYNAITNALGLDSLANLGLQLVMFAILGAAVGAVALRISLYIKKPRSS